ncbi:MAG TPA: extracellular solute-binding protein [Epulopiscium sp.]|nr:extracellular solute-binding protein [Candidatus Epulonipiscium sp.]
MKKLVKIAALGMSAMLLAASIAGCGSSAKSKDYDFYIFNTKGESADALNAAAAAYEAETGLKVKTFSLGAGTDSSEALRADMNSKNQPAIFSIMNIQELVEWEQGGFALDLNKATNADFKAMHDNVAPGLRLTSDGSNSFGIPYNVEGYGYVADTEMLSSLFGEGNLDVFLGDLRAANYEEFEAMVLAIDDFIKDGTSSSVTLNGTSYALATEKAGKAASLTGVFSVAGSEKWTYGDHLINIVVDTAFANPSAADAATDAQVDGMKGALTAYAQVLDLKSAHTAGTDGPLDRGPEFINSTTNGYDAAVQKFAESKAVFLKQGNWVYTNIEKANADIVDTLTFIPVKFPFKDSDIQVSGLTAAHINSSIPIFVPNYYAINAKVSKEEQEMAEAFLVWLNQNPAGQKFVTEDMAFIPYNADPATTTLGNSLGNSIIAYMKDDKTITNSYAGAPKGWTGDTVGLKIMEEYLTKSEWTAADYEAIADYAIEQWKAMK